MLYDNFDEDSCPVCAQYSQPDTTTKFNYAVLFEGDPPTESTTTTTTTVETTTTKIMTDGTTTVQSTIQITTTKDTEESDVSKNVVKMENEESTTKTVTTVDPDTDTTTVVETTTTVVVETTSNQALLCNKTMSYGVFLTQNVRKPKTVFSRYFPFIFNFRMILKRAKNVAVLWISLETNICYLFKLGI